MNTDKPLKDVSFEELRILSSTLFEAIQEAHFIGLNATVEKLRHIRQPIVDEMMQRWERLQKL